MRRNILVPVVLLMISIVTPICSHAAWSGKPAVNTAAIAAPGSNYSFPQVVEDGSGGAVIVGFDGGNHLHAQRLDANGNRLWSDQGVLLYDGNRVESFNLVSDGGGGVVVAWYEINVAGESNIYAQKVSGSGQTMWGAGGKPVCTAASEQYYISATGDGSGGIVVVWQDLRNSTKDKGIWDVYAQRINALGTEVWQHDGVPVARSVKSQLNPRVVSDGQDGAIVVWEGFHDDSDGLPHDDMRAQKISAAGALMWGAVGKLLSSYRFFWYSNEPRIIGDGAGGAIVAWLVYEGSASRGISANRIDSAGNVMWPGNAVITGSDFFTYDSLEIASDGSGGLFAAWIDYRNDTNTIPRIYAQRLDANGQAFWTGGGVPLTLRVSGRYLNSLSLTGDGSGGAIVTWDDNRNGLRDVFAQKLNPVDGSTLWARDGVPVSTAQGDQSLPVLTSDGSGGAIIAWMDGRDFSVTNIFAQRVMSNGQLPAVLTVAKAGTGKGNVGAAPGDLDWAGRVGTGTYERGAIVTLTAEPGPTSVFAGWSGACTGADVECSVAMSAAKNVKATFSPQ